MTTAEKQRFRRLRGLSAGDRVHLLMRDGCSEREIAGTLGNGAYVLTNGATITEMLEVNYHLPGQCPMRRRARRDGPRRRREEFTVSSESHPGVTYTVAVTDTGYLICNCGAGSYGRECKHKEHVKRLLREREVAASR